MYNQIGADALLERSLFVEFEALVKSLPDPLTFVKWWPRALVVPAYLWFPPLRLAIRFFAFQKVFTAVESLVGFIRAHEDLVDFLAHMEAQTHQQASTSAAVDPHPSPASQQVPSSSSSAMPFQQSLASPQHSPAEASSFLEESVHVHHEVTTSSTHNHTVRNSRESGHHSSSNYNKSYSGHNNNSDQTNINATAATSTTVASPSSVLSSNNHNHNEDNNKSNDVDDGDEVHVNEADFGANLSAIDTTVKDRLQEASRAIVELAKAKLSSLETQFPETVNMD
jgi:hypothetical protein